MASTTEILSAYTQWAAYFMLIQTIANQIIFFLNQHTRQPLRTYLLSIYQKYFLNFHNSTLTIIIEEKDGYYYNQVFDASKTYLRTIINPSVDRLKVSKSYNDNSFVATFDENEAIVDHFEGIQLTWKMAYKKKENHETTQFFELWFEKRYKENVLDSYLPYVLERANAIEQQNKVVQLHSNGDREFKSIVLNHASTFDTLAMDPKVKKALINDLDMFLTRKEFYKRVGKAWKRGYLLYGPPGTGKTSLIAAMANYLKFHIYTIQLKGRYSDSDLRRLLVQTETKSMIVIEDIDCCPKFQHCKNSSETQDPQKVTLSGLLKIFDGLWSSCGEERIIIFTTNYKYRLDPALLRPGCMDVHIYMGYCTPAAFKVLAKNYLSIEDHRSFERIQGLIEEVEITPAEIAEELMKSNEADTALKRLVQALLQKQIKKDADKVGEVKNDAVEVEDEEKKEEKQEEVAIKTRTMRWRNILKLKRKESITKKGNEAMKDEEKKGDELEKDVKNKKKCA